MAHTQENTSATPAVDLRETTSDEDTVEAPDIEETGDQDGNEKGRIEAYRERLEKAAARRRTEQKAKQNKQQREAEKRSQRIERGEPEGARERAAVAGRELKGVASAAGEVSETTPGGSTAKSIARRAIQGAKSQLAAAGGGAGGAASLRSALKQRGSSKPTLLMQGYEEKDGEMMGYYQAGDDGQKFYYVPGNENSRVQAKRLARQKVPDEPSGGRPSIRELAGNAAVDREFLSMGTRAEYDPAPPIRENRDAIQPQAGMGVSLGGGGLGFAWGGMGGPRAPGRSGGGPSFRWGSEGDEESGMFAGFDGWLSFNFGGEE